MTDREILRCCHNFLRSKGAWLAGMAYGMRGGSEDAWAKFLEGQAKEIFAELSASEKFLDEENNA